MLIQNVLMITENSSKHYLNVRAGTHFIDLSLKLKQVQHETVDYEVLSYNSLYPLSKAIAFLLQVFQD